MKEASKAMNRRGPEYFKYFKGNGIDVGCGPDCVVSWRKKFKGMRDVRAWDMADGDGQYLASVPDNSVSWIHSSHSLEHMRSWDIALENWIRVCAKGGHVICTVPSWEMYEHRTWPSQYNSDHKWAFSLVEGSGFIVQLSSTLLNKFGNVMILREITDGYIPGLSRDGKLIDQTADGSAECCIEFVIRKR